MINKFRYKKPANKDVDKVSDSGAHSQDNDTLKRISKMKVDSAKENSLKRQKKDGVLDEETKKQLHELFSQLQFSTETALPPDALRRALAESFFDQNRFQLGFMDDAAECFENMLLRIHTHIAQGEAEDMCNARHCIPHQKFAMTLVEQSVCGSCGATSEPLSYTQMVHYVSTSTLVYQVRSNAGRSTSDPFGQLLKKAGDWGDIRTCPSACGAVIQIGRTLMNNPEIVSVGLVWNSERPTLEHIMEVFSTIGTSLRLADVFKTVVDTRWAETSMHNLVGVVTYYGKHYSTFFFHTKLRVWIYFDDATVREVGPRWEQVVEKCRKGRYQPLLLLYALPDGTPVNTDNAPKQITPLFTDKVNKKPPQSVLRRSVTPSPEKPIIGSTRRAITPNPDGTSANQKPPLSRPYSEYQNLSIIQNNIYQSQEVDVVDGNTNRKDPEYAIRKTLDFNKPQTGIHRTLSNGSSSGLEGMSIPDHMNVPRRRDSGNWSGDRNSASSASSTTMENPYLYLVGKVPNGGGSVPGSPTRIKSDSSSGSSGVYDAGYDSYSLSSNDSSTVTTLQHLMKMGHLAKIPEDYNNPSTNQNMPSCDVLCDEADELLVKSRQLEDEHDLVLALALCNAAATKARAAMNAPYNNPQTLTLARMKHNTCIMRARSLHRRMTQVQISNKENPPEIRHTREGSSGSGRHSRQNSRDKGNHSRQNSRELLVPEKEKLQPTKNIEIYATLPKKKDGLKNKLSINSTEDEEYMLYDKPANRESRSIFSRSKNKDQKNREKRSRSEDRNKLSKDFSVAPEITTGKDTLKKAKEEKDDKKDKEGKSKKQHKIRRKLLMGGLIKRKNRSMPDLTDAVNESPAQPAVTTVDDSNLGLKGTMENQASLCGYLSEGHLEFAGNNPNPNLERSKLMRKSFHGSAGKILTVAKVPPPPPLRTTSQLSTSKLNSGEVCNESERLNFTQPSGIYYQDECHYMNQSPVSLPYYNNSFSDESFYSNGPNMVVTRADVHREQSSDISPSHNADSGVDEVDCFPTHSLNQNLELPPYPSPMGSVVHSRQASEDFPPPPPPLDLSALDEYLPQLTQPTTLLTQLQNKRQEILSQENDLQKLSGVSIKSTGDTWLKELQAKQAVLRSKKNQIDGSNDGIDVVNTQRYLSGESNVKSVRDLASKFETTDSRLTVPNYKPLDPVKSDSNGVLSMKKREEPDPIAPEQIAEELREVEMLNAAVQKTLSINQEASDDAKKRLNKKKSVSFCDQVILVATADEQEDDSFIPNPILERVLRTAMNKPETAAIRQEIMTLRENEGKEEKAVFVPNANEIYNKQLYVRRNSADNLLSKQNEQPVQRQSPTCNQPIYSGQNSYYTNQNIHYSGQVTTNLYNSHPSNGTHNSPVMQGHAQLLRQNSQSDSTVMQGQVFRQSDAHGRQIYPNEQYNSQLPPYICQNNLYDAQCTSDCSLIQNQVHAAGSRQSPYQPLPQNSPAYSAYFNRAQSNQHVSTPRSGFSPHIRSSTPSPMNGYPSYRTPSPVPSNCNYQQNVYRGYGAYDPPIPNTPYQRIPHPDQNRQLGENGFNQTYARHQTDQLAQGSPYQRVPVSSEQVLAYQRTPTNEYDMQASLAHQRVPYPTDVYQRIPQPHIEQDVAGQQEKYSPYQHIPAMKQILKKTVSFEPGTKGGSESPVPRAVVTPIIVNNANNSVPTDKTKCNLCRKKNVVALNLYCQDCEFYMSRFKPRS
ncbi:ubiquitin specific peptidase echinus isoform X1 [Leptinotarsa decemlineata]|uniref:ubiquitin specific peptidase echinus isoform X1 n=1 Tax=Leptinotarsa decemlineata TaxID=7539 RepID=UPI003D30C451